jgi:putative nucleotidyltransferase with HDIG domain
MSTQPPGVPGSPELQGFRAEVFSRTDLPTIPVVLGRILSVIEGERSSTRDLVEVIERDQALTSRLLKLANSALFGCSRKVATVPRGIVLLGFTTVRNLALGVKMWDTLSVGGRQGEMVGALWYHSALVAAASKLIATRIRGTDPDVTFTAGLLHDVGKLVISLKIGARYWSVIESATAERPIDVIEQQEFGVEHGQVGGWLAEAWRLPASIVVAIRDHHQQLLSATAWSSERVVSVADQLVHGTDIVSGELLPGALAVLDRTADQGFTAEDWAEMIGPLRAEADVLSGLFRGA